MLIFSVGLRTENPRVGGSIPPLATNSDEIDDQFLAISWIFRLLIKPPGILHRIAGETISLRSSISSSMEYQYSDAL
jgi:hypothetical protein